jgi:ferredoxin
VLRLRPLGHLSTGRNLARGNVAGNSLCGILAKAPMTRSFPITVHWRQTGRVIRHNVPEGDYILPCFERQGDPLPFSCRNGCCTACAVRVLAGEIDQREALGLSRELRSQGYGLLCVARATGPLEVETQDEDEVYDLQFGRHFGRGPVRSGLPLDEE